METNGKVALTKVKPDSKECSHCKQVSRLYQYYTVTLIICAVKIGFRVYSSDPIMNP